MKIQQVFAEEASLIARLNQPVHALHVAAHPDFFRDSTIGEIQASLKEYIAQENIYAFVAYTEAGEPAGYTIVFLRENPGHVFVHPQKFLYLDQIAVLPKFQGQGYGKGLMDTVKTLAKNLRAVKIILDTWAFNQDAHAFFQKQGFEIYNLRLWMDT